MYQVIVGNIGTVYEGNSAEHAGEVYGSYVQLSRQDVGRCAGESVVLMGPDGVESEHEGTLNDATWMDEDQDEDDELAC